MNILINKKQTITDIIPIKLGIVNSYLIRNGEDFILIDTGYTRKRKLLEQKLGDLGCNPENLKFIILTHQDFDHTGNAAYLSRKYNAKIAMHSEDSEAVERGDMLWNRKSRNIFTRVIFKILLLVLRIGTFEKFKPDIILSEGDNLSSFGYDASIIHIPGHSKGSIGVLTSKGDLFCGDLFMNTGKKPDKSSLIDVKEELDNSIDKLRKYSINTIYPGHGKPFSIEDYFNGSIQQNNDRLG